MRSDPFAGGVNDIFIDDSRSGACLLYNIPYWTIWKNLGEKK